MGTLAQTRQSLGLDLRAVEQVIYINSKNNVAGPILNTLSLFSGSGMLDLGFQHGCEALGIRTRVQAYVEWEAYAATTLLARMEDKSLEPVPVFFGDLADFPTAEFHGLVDIVCAGFPCPPVSAAGQRRGVEDERWLWPQLERVIREVGVGWVFLENVRGLLSANSGREFGEVLAGLARLGMHVEWLSLRASDVGAGHERERVFILAWRLGDSRCESFFESSGRFTRPEHSGEIGNVAIAERSGPQTSGELQSGSWQSDLAGTKQDLGDAERNDARRGRRRSERRQSGKGSAARSDELADAGCLRAHGHESVSGRAPETVAPEDDLELADTDGLGRRGQGDASGAPEEFDDGRAVVADPDQPGPQGRGHPGPAGWPLFAPGPADPAWPGILAERPWFAPAVEPGFCVLVDGKPILVDASRADQLRLSGNGVVALQASVAFVLLVERALS